MLREVEGVKLLKAFISFFHNSTGCIAIESYKILLIKGMWIILIHNPEEVFYGVFVLSEDLSINKKGRFYVIRERPLPVKILFKLYLSASQIGSFMIDVYFVNTFFEFFLWLVRKCHPFGTYIHICNHLC